MGAGAGSFRLHAALQIHQRLRASAGERGKAGLPSCGTPASVFETCNRVHDMCGVQLLSYEIAEGAFVYFNMIDNRLLLETGFLICPSPLSM